MCNDDNGPWANCKPTLMWPMMMKIIRWGSWLIVTTWKGEKQPNHHQDQLQDIFWAVFSMGQHFQCNGGSYVICVTYIDATICVFLQCQHFYKISFTLMVVLRKEWRILIDLLALDKDISRQNEKGYYEDKEKRLIRLKVSFPTRVII